MSVLNGAEVRSEVEEANLIAMEVIREEAMAIPNAEVLPIHADVEAMVAGTLDHAPDLRTLRAQFEHHRFPLGPVDKVEAYAHALLEAHVAHQPVEVDLGESALLAESGEWMEKCKTEEVVLVARKLMESSEFERITRRTGYRNRGLALACYVFIYTQAWSRIAPHTELTQSDLDHMTRVARRLIAISATRDPRLKARGEVLATEDMRRRAFHLLDKALTELRFQVSFLFRYEPEKVDLYLPQVRRKAGRKAASGPTAPNGEEPRNEEGAAAE
jgi:hypothetical protein